MTDDLGNLLRTTSSLNPLKLKELHKYIHLHSCQCKCLTFHQFQPSVRLRRVSLKDDVLRYIDIDESSVLLLFHGTRQVSIRLDGENKAVEYNAVGLTKDAVRAVFKNDGVDNLFDRNWHKIALSVEAKSVSLYLDCKLIQTLPIEDREDIDIQGKTVIGKRLYDSVPIDVSPPQISSVWIFGLSRILSEPRDRGFLCCLRSSTFRG